VNAFKAGHDNNFHPEQPRALGRPIARTAGSVLLPGKYHQWRAALLVSSAASLNREDLAIKLRHAAFDAGDHQVLDAHIGERSRASSPGHSRAARRSC